VRVCARAEAALEWGMSQLPFFPSPPATSAAIATRPNLRQAIVIRQLGDFRPHAAQVVTRERARRAL